MALRIEQSFRYQGSDWWQWAVWLSGSEAELDGVDHVVYTLHETFRPPVVKIENRADLFRLETSGWGVFMIYVTIVHQDGTRTELEHMLELEYPDGTPTNA